jgi:DNA-binding NtrC family response regulator
MSSAISNPGKILVVDDEDMIRRSIRSFFTRRGYQILEAESGNTAFELLSRERVDLVISDIQMLNGDGIELARKIHAEILNPPPLILISGHSDGSQELRSTPGVFDFISKPFDFRKLLESAQQACARQTGFKEESR